MEDKQQRRFKAVLALLKGEPVSMVIVQFGICRSDLYKFRRRALTAMWEALCDSSRGPNVSQNRICKEKEEQIKSLCERHPTLSSYQIRERMSLDSPSPRTIQRLRQRLGLPRLPKRAPPQSPAKQFSSEEKRRVQQFMQSRTHLGALRLSWDVTNILKISISASTTLRWRREIDGFVEVKVNWQFYERKHPHSLWHGDVLKLWYLPNGKYVGQMAFMDDYSRGYVACELIINPTTLFTVRCLIQAMRQWQVIPKAILVDNSSEFKGFLLKGFCENLGIRLIHIRAYHPQTNGKLERAFRDDRRDFYGLRKGWSVDALKRDLPNYVYYRNYQRGHWALNGSPAITRLREQNWMALPSVLNRLEDYARYELGEKSVNVLGYTQLLGKPLYIGERYRGKKVKCFGTVNGLEIQRVENGSVIGTLPNYYVYRQLRNSERPKKFVLRRFGEVRHSPRIAVAL